MSDRVFIDTNLLVYFISDDESKKTRSREILLSNEVIISTQVIGEFISVYQKKKLLDVMSLRDITGKFIRSLNPVLINHETILGALEIQKSYD